MELGADQITVLKFGSSVLARPEHMLNVVHEIYRWYRHGDQVIAVVSALGATTNELLEQSWAFANSPEPYATAELLATGERSSAALLGIALDRAGVPARVLNPCEIGLTVSGHPLDSELTTVDVERVRTVLDAYPVLVIPGFFGTARDGRTHLLGRGGSDLTAVFLADALAANRCRLIKDVDGVYECDPARAWEELTDKPRPRRFQALSYDDALRFAGPLIQAKAVQCARLSGVRVEVAALTRGFETVVHDGPTQLDAGQPSVTLGQPVRVALLGLGTVGFGVYQRLLANPEHFQIVGAFVRDRSKYEHLGVPSALILARAQDVLSLRCEVVIDMLPNAGVTRPLIESLLSSGIPVISANKALVAASGMHLAALARNTKAALSYSATVGGATPMIEAIRRCVISGKPIASLSAVLNGTCNFILDQCSEGKSLPEAIAEAQTCGFAEAGAHDDLSGEDAARKLVILSRHAFGTECRLVEMQRLDESIGQRAAELGPCGLRMRQIARLEKRHGAILATVRYSAASQDSPLGRLRREWNALEILAEDGQTTLVSGRGAGRWPTTESVMADLFAFRRGPLCEVEDS